MDIRKRQTVFARHIQGILCSLFALFALFVFDVLEL